MIAVEEAHAAVPRHVGIIMDGNGRWAERLGKPRLVGHRMGAAAVRRTTEAALKLGVRQLTLFAFSSENWRRPAKEVDFLMRLFRRFLKSERGRLSRQGIRLRVIGRLHELPELVRRELRIALKQTRDGRDMDLCLAVNYGGRNEIVDACRQLSLRVAAGEMRPTDIDIHAFEAAMYQSDMPPLDLVIRTGGEMRLSNFLIWQAAYAELWCTPVCWPDFGEQHLKQAVEVFGRRERRFGGLPSRKAIPPQCDAAATWASNPDCPNGA